MRRMIRRTALATLVLALLGAAAAPGARGATILVKPGKLDHFVLTAPPTALAGESFIVRVEPFDANNNLITEFRGKGGVFAMNVSGGGEAAPARLKAEELAGGATVRVSTRRAGALDFSVTEGEGTTPLANAQVRVLPNRLDRFVVNAPKEATAGEVFQVRVIALDAFGNTKDDLADVREGLRVEVVGSGSGQPADKVLPPFRGGEATFSFLPRKAGPVRVAVQETRTRSAGESAAFPVNPAALDHFTVLGPKTAVAGEKFVLIVSAYDAYENVVTNYQSRGDGVALRPSGTGSLAPASVFAKEFKDGQARVTATYTKAEPLRVAAREANREAAGESEPILVTPGDPDHFRVTTPAEAVAGEGFPVQVEAFDRHENLIEDYDLRGHDVLLTTDGRGQLSPGSVSPASFVRGKATVNLLYNRAESFTVIAALSKESLEKIVAERKRQATAAPPSPVVTPEEAAKERERAATAKAREEALRAREEAEQERAAAKAREEQRTKEEAARKKAEAEAKAREEAEAARAAAKPAEPPAPVPGKAPEPPAKPVEKAPAPPAGKDPEKPVEKAPAKAPEKAPEPPAAKSPEKPAEKAPEKPAPQPKPAPEAKAAPAPRPGQPGVKVLEKATVEASKDQLVLRLVTSGPVSYNASTGSRLSKEWIWLELFPVRVDAAVGQRVPVTSPLVGEITVEQPEPEKARISLQVLPPGISYVVTQQDRAVVVKVVRAE